VLPPGRPVTARAGRAVCPLADGRTVVWEPAAPCGAIACHAQKLDLDRPARETLVRRYGLPRGPVAFACAWTRAEVMGNLFGMSPWAWLARGARAQAMRVRTTTLVRPELGLVISLGLLPSGG
jgi:hypothetical protein